jgi:hypothetical protein
MTKDDALKLALEVMHNQGDVGVDEWIATEAAINQALAAPVQEPVAWRLNGISSLGHGKVFGDWKSGKPPKDVADLASVDKNWSLEFTCTTPSPVQEPVARLSRWGIKGESSEGYTVHFLKELPPDGSLFYTTPPAAAQPAEPAEPEQPEQEPVTPKWSDAGNLKRLKKGDVLRVLRKGQEYYKAFKFCGSLEECDYTYDGNNPFVWMEVGMAYSDKIVYTRKDFSTGAVYADRGDVVEILQPTNYTAPPAAAQPVTGEKIYLDDGPEWNGRFEKWWEDQGQFCRAGGGEYEKTFAFRAWEAALATPPAAQRQWVGLTDAELADMHATLMVKLRGCYETKDLYKAIEQRLKDKNT